MLALVKQHTTLVVVLLHGDREIERCVRASPDAAIAAAIRMRCAAATPLADRQHRLLRTTCAGRRGDAVGC